MDQQQWQEFLSSQGARWHNGAAEFDGGTNTGNGTATELQLTDLTPMGAISVSGPDSQKFLQGQVTCDLLNLPDEHLTLGSHCNPKGRMISAFYALKIDQTEFVLLLPRDLATTALTALKKYAVFFKTELTDISDQYHWLALCGRDANKASSQLLNLSSGADTDLVAGQLRTFDHNGQRTLAACINERVVMIQVATEQSADLWQKLDGSPAVAAGFSNWQSQLIEAGLPLLYQSTSETFIPQMLNLHLLGGVSFKKGCYTGQEVVARMQYLGAAKRRMYRARIDRGDVPEPGAEIFAKAGGSSVGNIVMATDGAGAIDLLAVLTKSKVADGESLQLKDERVLELLELPYDADADPLA